MSLKRVRGRKYIEIAGWRKCRKVDILSVHDGIDERHNEIGEVPVENMLARKR